MEWEKYNKVLLPAPTLKSNNFSSEQIPSNAAYVRLFFLSYGYNKKYWIDNMRFEPFSPVTGTYVQGDTKIARSVENKENINIDGKLTESVWQSSDNWNSGFVRTVCDQLQAQPVPSQTRFKVTHDKKNIYMGIECKSKNIKNIKSQPRKYNSMDVFSDEDIEIFLDCSGQRKQPLQIAVNASGSFTELFYGAKRNFGLEAASTRTSSGWTAEVRIPKDRLWQYFTEANSSVDKYLWNINICRHQPGAAAKERYSAWNYTGNAFANKNALGVLLFEKNETVLSNRANEAALQIKKQLVENKHLLNKSSLAAIQNEQANIFSIESFIKNSQQALSYGPVMPDYIFSRYLSEIDAVPECLNSSFQALRRFSLAFPKEREKYGYMIFEVPLVSPVDNKIMPSNGECKQFKMRIAGDEISSRRFSVFTRKVLKDIKLRCSALKSKTGAQIPENKIDLRILNQWGSRHQADILVTDERVKLDGWLEKYADHPRFVTNIPANSTKHFLLQVTISPDVPPGIYKGSIHIEPIGNMPTNVPVIVEVLPFQLERTDRCVGFFYTGVLFQPKGPAIGSVVNSFCNGLTTEKSMRDEFEALSSSGFNFIPLGGYAGGSLNIDYVSKILEIAGKAGIKKIAIQGAEWIITPDKAVNDWKKDEGAYKTLAERISKIAKIAKKNGIELYIFGLDEPNDEIGVLRNNIIFEIAKRCGVDTTVAIIRDDIREQIKGLDMVSMNYLGMSSGNSKLLDMISRKEKVPYKNTIYYANMGAEYTPGTRMAFGWYLVKSHMGGNTPWAYYTLWQNWKPFGDDATTVGQDGYVYPTKDRPISTLKYEAAREGVNDLRYLEMLQKYLASGKNKPKAKEYGVELGKMLNTFSILNTKAFSSENFLISPKVYDDYRNKVQDMLIDLVKDEHISDGNK